jgi:hypothetical protein
VVGYNAQAVVAEGKIVIAAEVTVETSDFSQLEPMITKAREELAAARAKCTGDCGPAVMTSPSMTARSST